MGTSTKTQHKQVEVQHVPGVENVIPDYLSRIHCWTETKDWKLNRQEFNKIWGRWGPLRTDLFASHWNHQLKEYIVWREDHHMINAFYYRWRDGDYAFPPFSIIDKVLNKVRLDKCSIILVAPKWENQHWFPILKEMLWDKPIQFPFREALLRDKNGNSHPIGQSLHLTAWPITGVASKRRVYLTK